MDHGDNHALAYLDLDKFKAVNDSCGHSAGDELLRQVAIILTESTRKRDTVGRLGGDEFGILMEHCSLQQAERVAESIREKIADFRFRWSDHVFTLGVSTGLVQITDATRSIATLFKVADAACYSAKKAGRNQVRVHYPGDATLERGYADKQWASAINTALQEQSFQLVAQPARALTDPTVAPYVEVLIRYPDATGIHSAHEFLPAAERSNLSMKIDSWVLENFLIWYAAHRTEIDPRTLFAFNLSTLSLTNDGFLRFVNQQLNSSVLSPERLCFEITEAAVISNLAQSTTFLKAIKERGCLFALDDFGSGLSSINYLRSMPIDFVKIDGLLVRDSVTDPIDLALIESIN